MTQYRATTPAEEDLINQIIQLEEERDRLKVELASAYGLIEVHQVEIKVLRRRFKKTLDETIETCDALLEELAK
jgi:hypothetical protein